jgi:hypothetical protein
MYDTGSRFRHQRAALETEPAQSNPPRLALTKER